MTLTCCQDHILTENIWLVWSETSYCGDERRCHGCGTANQPNFEDRATQLEAEFRNLGEYELMASPNDIWMQTTLPVCRHYSESRGRENS